MQTSKYKRANGALAVATDAVESDSEPELENDDSNTDTGRGPITGGSVTLVCTAFGTRESKSTGERARCSYNFGCSFFVRVRKGVKDSRWVVRACCLVHAGNCAPSVDNANTRKLVRGGELMARLSEDDKIKLLDDLVSHDMHPLTSISFHRNGRSH